MERMIPLTENTSIITDERDYLNNIFLNNVVALVNKDQPKDVIFARHDIQRCKKARTAFGMVSYNYLRFIMGSYEVFHITQTEKDDLENTYELNHGIYLTRNIKEFLPPSYNDATIMPVAVFKESYAIANGIEVAENITSPERDTYHKGVFEVAKEQRGRIYKKGFTPLLIRP